MSNSQSIFKYIHELEELQAESRTKIEQLKNLLKEANEETVQAQLSNSLYDTTSNPVTLDCVNHGIAERLRELGDMTSDFYKDASYKRAATIIEHLPKQVQSGESVVDLNGIGSLIAAKIDEYLDELDSDYEESVASEDTMESEESEEEESEEEESESEESEFISYNTEIYDMLRDLGRQEQTQYKKNTYDRAAESIFYLPYAVKNPYELSSGPNKVKGIGKGIAKKIDEFLNSNDELVNIFLKMGNLEDNLFKCKAYWRVSDILRTLPDKITCGNQVKNMDGFGKSTCAMIDEFGHTGSVKRLEELRSK